VRLTAFPDSITDQGTHGVDDTNCGGAVDAATERHKESALTTAPQIVPQPQGWTLAAIQGR